MLELDTLLAHFGDCGHFSTQALRRELNIKLLPLLANDKRLALAARSEGFIFDSKFACTHTCTHVSNGANGLKSYGDMIIIHMHTLAST